MTLSPTALATARRNVTQRIAWFLEALEKAGRNPDPWEAEHVQRALQALDDLDFPAGETAMMWAEWSAERRSPDMMAALQPAHAATTTAQLRARLETIVRDAAA
jgi:hypothetical protein